MTTKTKNNNPSFADRARKIQQKYKRAEFDSLEQKDMEAELEALMAEQEAVRESMGLNEQQPNTQMYDGFNSTQTIEDINNPKQYPNGRIYQDDRGWIEKGLDRLYGSYETNKPQLLKDFPILDTPGMMLQYITGNTPSDGNIQGGAPLLIGGGGKGFKNLPINRTIPKQTFVKTGFNSRPNITPKYAQGVPQPKITSVPKGVVPGSVTNIPIKGTTQGMDDALNLANKNTINEMRATQTELSRQNALGAYKNRVAQAQLNKAQQAANNVSKSYGNLEGTVNPLNPNWLQTLPWSGIGYGAAGIGGAGLLGAGIYGLTQLPDGTVVDKQGNPVNPNSSVDAMSGANMPISKQAGFQPTKEYLDAIGWNSKLPTVQQVRSGSKGSGAGNKVIKQDLVTPEYLTPEQASRGIETDISLSQMPRMVSKGITSTVPNNNLGTMNTLSESQIADLNKQLNKSKGLGFNLRKGLQNVNVSDNLPYLLSGASNIVGNLLLANAAKKIPQVQPVYATPERINLEPKANLLRQQADVSKNVNMMNARNLGLNPGATLGSMGVMNAGVDRGLSDALTNLYMGQEQANVGTANQFALQNQDVANRVNSFNAGLKYQGLQDKLGYLGAALGTIPGVMKDIRADKADQEMRAVMDSYYKSLGGKNYLSVGSIFDTSFGKYKVKGYNPDGTPITEKVK